MSSDKQKGKKLYADIIWLIFTTILSCIITVTINQKNFWSYSIFIYIIPIIINMSFFSKIYDCYENRQEFDEKFIKKYGYIKSNCLDVYYQEYNTAIRLINLMLYFLLLFFVVMIFVTIQFNLLNGNVIVKGILYIILYTFFLMGAIAEKLYSSKLTYITEDKEEK